MSRPSDTKILRRNELKTLLDKNPFMSDQELAEHFSVSVPTIRLDRSILNIPELRERVKGVAVNNLEKVKSISAQDLIGELVEFEINSHASSVMLVDCDMTFQNTKVVRGNYIYSMAESLAISIIDSKAALVGIANIKYRRPVKSGDLMVAKATVKKKRDNKYIVWVKIFVKNTEVFQGKFILVSI